MRWRDVLVVARLWSLGPAAAMAAGLALAVALVGDERTSVPTLRTAVLVDQLAPALAALLLTRPLVDSYESLYDAAPRSPLPHRTLRSLLVLALVSTVALADRATGSAAPFLAFLAVAAALTPWLRTTTWLPLLVLGYGWLQLVAAREVPAWLSDPRTGLAASAVGLAAYLGGYRLRDRRRTSGR